MTHAERLALTFLIIFISLGVGYLCRRLVESGKIGSDQQVLIALRKELQSFAVFVLIPLSALLSLWGLPRPDSSLLFLPLLGLVSYVWGGILALWAARLLRLDRARTGSMFCCGTFTNIGAVGGLVCLIFLGENSIALVALYRLLEEIYFFSVSFPVAKWHSPDNRETTLTFRNFRVDPLMGIVVVALLIGITLNLLKAPRPAFLGTVASVSLLCATIFFLLGIGLSLRLSRVLCYIRPCAAICLIKFLLVPLVVTGLAALLGLAAIDNGLPLKVVAVLSSMPVAMTALIPPSLFNLDLDLANACWIISTLGLVATLPALMFVLPLL